MHIEIKKYRVEAYICVKALLMQYTMEKIRGQTTCNRDKHGGADG